MKINSNFIFLSYSMGLLIICSIDSLIDLLDYQY